MSSSQPGSPYRAPPAPSPSTGTVDPRSRLRRGIYHARGPRAQLEGELEQLGEQSVRSARRAGLLGWGTWLCLLPLGTIALVALRRHDDVLSTALLTALAMLITIGFGLRTIHRARVFRPYPAAESLRLMRGLELEAESELELRIDLYGRSLVRGSSRAGAQGLRWETDRWLEIQGTLCDGAGFSLERVDERTEAWHSHSRVVTGRGKVRTDYTTETESSGSTKQSLHVRLPAEAAARLAAYGEGAADLVAKRVGTPLALAGFGVSQGVLEVAVNSPVDLLAIVEAVYQLASPGTIVVRPSPPGDLVIPWRVSEPTLPNLWGNLTTRQKRLAAGALGLLLAAAGAGYGGWVTTGWSLWDLNEAELCERDLQRDLARCQKGPARSTLCRPPAELKAIKAKCRDDRDMAAGRLGWIIGWWLVTATLLAAAIVVIVRVVRRPAAEGAGRPPVAAPPA
jgi:hypothetical protein